jgi:hypothetical protein
MEPMTSNLLMGVELPASVAFKAVLRGDTCLGMSPISPGAEGSSLGPIQNSTTEIRICNLGIGKAALHQHGISQQGTTQIGFVQTSGIDNRILQIHIPQIGPLKIAAVEDSTPQIRPMEIHALQIRFEEFLLLEVATMHIGLNLLKGSLSS